METNQRENFNHRQTSPLFILLMVVVECFDLKFDGGLYGGLAVVAVARSGANGGYRAFSIIFSFLALQPQGAAEWSFFFFFLGFGFGIQFPF
ncbi:hypothetical protein CMV_005826 [Castanea mollissima]|uniref:Uncharacterized protein n=1 Tax=Castanea mollissima TaxID=60419 RepID=A0A8J4VU01_9ROSI|nr:hypothetical protein CMV_005826 [Castanea mollissima]